MDATTAKALLQLGTYGPLGIMCVLFFILFMLQKKETQTERDKNEKLAYKLHELGLASLKADMEHTQAYTALEKMIDATLDALAKRDSHEKTGSG